MPEKEEVKPYSHSLDSKKGQVTTMFDNIAPYYDGLNRFLSLGIDVLWRKRAIKSLQEDKPKTILDIATGTADLAIEAAKTLGPERIIGLDISPNMLEIGKKKVAKSKLDSVISLEVGDSEAMRFEDNSFDAVTVAFGVRNFENLEKGLAEIYRVLAIGGKVVVLEFSKPRIFPLKQLFHTYFKYILPVIGKLGSKDDKAYTYLYESVQAFPDYENFTTVLQKIGFKESKYKALSAGICTIYTARK